MKRCLGRAFSQPALWIALRSVISLALLLISPVVGAVTLPPLEGYVMAATDSLSAAERSELSAQLNRESEGNEVKVLVLVLRSLDGATIENVAERAFHQYGVARGKGDDGVLLVIAEEERRVRIQTSASARAVLKDDMAASIINTQITPLLQAGKLREALIAGTNAIFAPFHAHHEARKSRSSVGYYLAAAFVGVPVLAVLVIVLLAVTGIRPIRGSNRTREPRLRHRHHSTSSSSGGHSSYGSSGGGSSGGGDTGSSGGGASGSY